MSLDLIVCPIQLVGVMARRHQVDGILSVMPRHEMDGAGGVIDAKRLGSARHDLIEVSDLGCGSEMSERDMREILIRHPTMIAPSREIVDRILDVGRSWLAAARERDVTLLIHCHGGVSRSPAAALLILALEDGPGHEARSWTRLCEVLDDPYPLPNANIIRLGDEALGRDGALMAVWEQGQIAAAKAPLDPDIAAMFR